MSLVAHLTIVKFSLVAILLAAKVSCQIHHFQTVSLLQKRQHLQAPAALLHFSMFDCSYKSSQIYQKVFLYAS